MSRASHMGVVAYEAESSWGENVATWGVRLPHVGKVDVSGLTRTKQPSNRLVGYRNEITMGIPGPMGGSFSISLYLTGHGSSTSGATSVGEVEQLLAYVFGAGASTGTGTTFTGGTATAPTTTASGTLTTGGIIWSGAINDGGGNGQPAAISSHSATTLNLLTALPGSPTNGDVCYSSVVISTEETTTNTNVAPLRFLLATANLQYRCHGCYPTNVEFSGLNPNETPMVTITFGVSWWSHAAETFPGTDTMNDFMPCQNSGGSLFFAARGTATRSTLTYRSFSLTYQMGIQPTFGPGAAIAQQGVTGAVRTQDSITMEIVVDAEAATTSPTHTAAWDSETQFHHLLYNLNGASTGQRVCFYFPNVCYDENRPTQRDVDNINRVRIFIRAGTGTTTTSDLTQSAFRMAWG
jgi:hypothetical protein